MTPPAHIERYKNHRFPGEIISHGVWLYYRFSLSYRDVQELLFARGIDVTDEAIRHWCRTFGQDYAHQLRRRRPRPGDQWYLDAVFLTINGQRHYLWRAVDQDDNVLDILVQRRRNKKAAKQCFKKLLTGLRYVPCVLITDQLKSSAAAKREVMPPVHDTVGGSTDGRRGLVEWVARRTSPYFRSNAATRPAVSITFCRPVKYGWQCEQTDTRCSGTVERVCRVAPQLHVIVASA